MRIFFLLFFLVPVIEILLFIWLGQSLGAWTIVSLIFLTALLGIVLARHQGLENLRRAQQTWVQGSYPTNYMINSLCILIGAFLLIIPGFITDLAGLALLIPFSRNWFKQYLIKLLQKMFNRGTFIYWRRF